MYIIKTMTYIDIFFFVIERRLNVPDNPPTSIFFKFLASNITTVSFPAVGTYLNEKQMSPNLLSCMSVG